MRHRKKHKILDRDKSHRKALLKNLAKSLFIHQKIKTTLAKAKYLKPFVEELITIGKNDNLANLRLLIKKIGSDKTAKKIIKEIAPKYKERKGGYIRIIRLGFRAGNGAEMVIIELI